MSAWNSVKSAFRTLTGTQAEVTLRLVSDAACVGEHVDFEVTLRAKVESLEARALVVDLVATETIRGTLGQSTDRSSFDLVDPAGGVLDAVAYPIRTPVTVATTTFERTARVSGSLTLKGESERVFRARVQIPPNAEPSFQGRLASHRWQIRARLDVFGADPSSAWTSLLVCRPMPASTEHERLD
jgi:hypothetical protein